MRLVSLFTPLLCLLFVGTSGAQQEHQHHEPILTSGLRTWMVDGAAVEGSIHAINGPQLLLVLADTSQKSVPLDKLSETDRHQVQLWEELNKAPEGFGEAEREIAIKTLQGQMRYDLDVMIVSPGAKVKVVLQNLDDMHHNLVICTPDSDHGMEVAQAAWALGGDGFEKQWIPVHAKILAASRMADPHTTSYFYFTAPSEEGDYPYVCTLPGHAAFMKGVLRVQSTPTALSELTYMLYEGDFNRLPDFKSLTPVATDHVASGVIDLSVSPRRDRFAVLFNGQLNVPETGLYRFQLASDDGSRLSVDGEVLIDHDGIHGRSRKRGEVKLEKGAHSLELAYFEQSGEEALDLVWSGPGFKNASLSLEKARSGEKDPRGIPLAARGEETRLYRNFIEGAGNRAIGAGFAEGINMAFDADQMRLALVWLGGFMDAARHWEGRGQGQQPPLGYGVFATPKGVPFAPLATLDVSWPDSAARAKGYRFKGYRLEGQARAPRFHYEFSGTEVNDQFAASGDVRTNDARLSRQVTLTNVTNPANLYFRAAVAADMRRTAENTFLVNNQSVLTLEDGANTEAVLREINGQKELLMPLVFKDGEARFTQHFSYNLSAQ